MASDDRPTLAMLPDVVLDRVLEAAFSLDRRLPVTALCNLGRRFHTAARRILARKLVLEDDDNALLDAESPGDESASTDPTLPAAEQFIARTGSHASSLLARVLADADWAQNVQELVVTNPAVSEDPQDGTVAAAESAAFGPLPLPPPPPLNDAAFFLLVSRLGNLTTLAWHSHRPPPDLLCVALGQACKNLTRFELDLVPAPSAHGDVGSPHHATTASPILGTSPISSLHTSPVSGAAIAAASPGHPNGASAATSGAIRWDAPHLAALPEKLAHLSLAGLSAAGTKNLSSALPSLPALERLDLAKTLFVDDAVLAAVGEHAKGLQVLRIREMGGTKLSETGIGHVLEGCPELRELSLEAVEGRLSRACWHKLTPLPPNLRDLRLAYSELAPHKSWVLDHFASLSALLAPENSNLRSLALTRILPSPRASVPGSHHLARYPIDGVLEPRPFETRDLDALVEQGESLTAATAAAGREWQELEVDLFKVDQEQLKRTLEGCPKLRRLKVMFDGPFRNLLALAPSFAACPDLQHLQVAIPPEHASEMAGVTPHEYFAAVGSWYSADDDDGGASAPELAGPVPEESGAQKPAPGGGHARRRSSLTPSSPGGAHATALPDASPSTPRGCAHHPLAALDSLLPPLKDWRRFLKKAHALERVTWTGRGGLGRWEFSQKKQGSSLAKVEFWPTRPVGPVTAAAGEARGEAGWGYGQGQGSPTRTRSRTASSAGAGTGLNISAAGAGPGFTQSPPAHQRRRSSSISLAGSCFSNLSLDPGAGCSAVDTSFASSLSFSPPGSPSPVSPLSVRTAWTTPPSAGVGPLAAFAFPGGSAKRGPDLFEAPGSGSGSAWGLGTEGPGNGHGCGLGRHRSSAASSGFGAVGGAGGYHLGGGPGHGLAHGPGLGQGSALGLSVHESVLEQDDPWARNAGLGAGAATRDLFGWAADTALATATTPEGVWDEPTHGEHVSYEATAAQPSSQSLPATKEKSTLSFAAALASSPAPQMGRQTSAASAASARSGASSSAATSSVKRDERHGTGNGNKVGGSLCGSGGGSGEKKHSPTSGRGGGGGGGGASNRSHRNKSSSAAAVAGSPKQGKGASSAGGGGNGDRGRRNEPHGEGADAAGGGGKGASSSSATAGQRRAREGARRREATQ
ncbi:hypothetical protein JCM8202_003499 [Rhodotorula sphaerocarpa]